MQHSEQAHRPRPKFDTLFTDPRHYRSDCRLVRTALRRGWLEDATEADRAALVARLNDSARVREGARSECQRDRAALAHAQVLLEMVGKNQRDCLFALRYCWAGEWTGRTTGRPRERRYVGEFRSRIDVYELSRRALAEGTDLRTARAIEITRSNGDGSPERVALMVNGPRISLLCPRCGTRRAHLYVGRVGIGCRGCLRIRYRDRRGSGRWT
jgi:hypothetical protein